VFFCPLKESFIDIGLFVIHCPGQNITQFGTGSCLGEGNCKFFLAGGAIPLPQNRCPESAVRGACDAPQELHVVEGVDDGLGYGEQGQLQAGGQGERLGGAAEERGVESGEGDRQTGARPAGRQHQTTRSVPLAVLALRHHHHPGPILSVFPALTVHSVLKSVHPGFPVAFIFKHKLINK